jgi:hypothetical protein
MAVHLEGAYLLGYNQTNNFFGDTLFRRGSTATMTVSAIIDVRPGGSDGYPGSANTDHLGAKEAFDVINSQADNIGNWQEIQIDYGLGNKVVATGRVLSLSAVRQNPVRIGEYTVTLEIPISGSEDAFNMEGPINQTYFQNSFPGDKVKNIFKESGAAFANFSENFAFSVSDDKTYEYEHSLNVQMLSGQHLAPEPIETSKDVARIIFNAAPANLPAFGFIDDQFSGFYRDTNIPQGGDVSGVKYFSEVYDLVNLNCTFSKKCRLNNDLKEDYSLALSHSLTLNENGIVNVTENGLLKSTLGSKTIAERFTDVRGFLETEINNSYARCSSLFESTYKPIGFFDPNYQGEDTSQSSEETENLVTKPIKIGRSYQPNLATAQYSTSFINHQGKYLANFIHEYTQTVNEDEAGVIGVTENGKVTPYSGGSVGEANKNNDFYVLAKGKYNGMKSDIKTRANTSYAGYKSRESEDFEELLNEHYPRSPNVAAEPSLMPISKQVSMQKYGVSFDYTHVFSDDPSLLKSSESLYQVGFRRFSIATNDTFMTPMNSTYTIPALRTVKGVPHGKQIVHDGTQTAMGNRNFTIQGFLARPTSNVLSDPSVWELSKNLNDTTIIGNKVNMVKDVISQKMADIVADVGFGKNSEYDIFVKDVSFTLNSKGEFSVQGNIPFVKLGGVKHDTLGKLMK